MSIPRESRARSTAPKQTSAIGPQPVGKSIAATPSGTLPAPAGRTGAGNHAVEIRSR